MKAICEGRSTRGDVVQQNLEQYRAVFTRTMQQMNVLKSVGQAFQSGVILVLCSRIANARSTQAITKYVVNANHG